MEKLIISSLKFIIIVL